MYDPAEIASRIAQGRLVSCVAMDDGEALLCHVALNRERHRDEVGHVGQAVTIPAARGQHLFTSVKRHLAGWAVDHGMVGMYSEATAAHPYSQQANVDLGAHETGFMLGWIPSSVSNDAAAKKPGPAGAGRGGERRRQSAVLFYLRMRPGHTRPVYAPRQHRDIVHEIISTCELRGRLADPPGHVCLPPRTHLHCTADEAHNLAVLHVTVPGADLDAVVARTRDRLFGEGRDVVYVDLPLDTAATGLVADHLETLGVTFSGIFPNVHADGDVLRMQSLNEITVSAHDVAVVSDHGSQLLAYVLKDLDRASGGPAEIRRPG